MQQIHYTCISMDLHEKLVKKPFGGEMDSLYFVFGSAIGLVGALFVINRLRSWHTSKPANTEPPPPIQVWTTKELVSLYLLKARIESGVLDEFSEDSTC